MNNVRNPIDNKKCYDVLKECEKVFSEHNRESLDALEIGLQKCNIQLNDFDEKNDYIGAMKVCLNTLKELHSDARDALCEKESEDLDRGVGTFLTYCRLANISACIR